MKSQIVLYRDLFNPDELIYARNKAPQKQQSTSLKSFVKRARMFESHKSKCKCKHMKIGDGGYCLNSRCRHFEIDHKPYTEINYISYW
jgi:hypothetical protein